MIRKRKTRIEEQHQVAFVAWFRLQYPQYAKLLTLGSFGENVGEKRMARLKQMGLTPGFPDLFLALPKRTELHKFKRKLGVGMEEFIEVEFVGGLYIEMKTKTGKVSTEQKEIHELLKKYHYKVDICRSWEEAKASIIDYFANC
jgi:hypothetical protein